MAANPWNPYRESLVQESETIWPAELNLVNAADRQRFETQLHADPAKAEKGSIRKDFGLDIERNAVHGSDSPKTADQEIKLFFKDSEILSYERK